MPGVRRSPRPITALATAVVAVAATLALVAPAQAAAPSSPAGLTPSGAQSVSGIPTLTWTRSPGATVYDVQVSASSSFSSPASYSTVNRQLVPDFQVPLGLDYWRVRARNNAGTSDWTTASFTRADDDPPTLLSPISATLQEPDNPPVLKWSPVPGALNYTVQVSTDGSFADQTAITRSTPVSSYLVVPALASPPDLLLAGPGHPRERSITAWSSAAAVHPPGAGQAALQGPTDDIDAPCRTSSWTGTRCRAPPRTTSRSVPTRTS